MTLVRALPPLAPHAPPRASNREQLQRLEEVARQELAEMKRLADARPAPAAPVDELGVAWDLGLAGNAL